MISCTDFLAEMGNYLDNDVALEVRKQLEAHLAHCQTCHVIYDSSRKTVKVVTDSKSFDLPDAAIQPMSKQIMSRIRAQQPK